MKRYKTKFKKNVLMDAILVHGAMHGLFVPAAIYLGMTPDEANERAYWLKSQSEDYISKVSEAVASYERRHPIAPQNPR